MPRFIIEENGDFTMGIGFLSVTLTVIFLLTCLLVILIVLLQPSHGEGLGSAFGGGISESFFGTRAMTWLARATIVLALFFLALTIILNKLPRGTTSDGSVMGPSGAPIAPVAAPDDEKSHDHDNAPAPGPESTPAPASSAPAAPAPTPAAPAPAPAPAATPAPAPAPAPAPESAPK
jgi:preprotein translocase subunit SecG